MKIACSVATACFLTLVVTPVPAQDTWPAKPVRFVVPTSPGGSADVYARLLAQGVGEAFKRQFIVDNRPGGGENIGAEVAARAAPDGYTFLVAGPPALLINPNLYKNLPYNAERDFTPVAQGVISPSVFASHPSVPAKTLPALLALAKREPGKLAYGSPGTGSSANLAVKMFEETAKVRFLHVPYKGGGPAVIGLLSGEVAFLSSTVLAVQPHAQSRRLVPLAASHRTPNLPGTPTFAEAGYPQVDAYPTFSVVAPMGTSPAIIQRMSAEIVKLMKTPAFREKLGAQALLPVFDTPDEFAAVLKKGRARYAEVIRRNNIVPE